MLIEDWIETKRILDESKKKELDLRNQIMQKYNNRILEGIEKHKEGSYNIKITRKITRSLDEAELNSIFSSLSDEEKAAIKYKPSLVAKEFKLLKGDEKLFDVITIKPALASLEITFDE